MIIVVGDAFRLATEEEQRILQGPLGAVERISGSNQVMENEALKLIVKAHGKTLAQISRRWIVEQDATVIIRSLNTERMKQNRGISDRKLTDDEYEKSNHIQQQRLMHINFFVSSPRPL